MPPPLPIFSGRTVDVILRDDVLLVRPLGSHVFQHPRGTLFLRLPALRIVSVERSADNADGSVGLAFRGGFHAQSYGTSTELSPIDPSDAAEIVSLLNLRLALPRIPTLTDLREPHVLDPNDFVIACGTRVRAHFESADFVGVKLDAGYQQLATETRYVVTGFLQPGARFDLTRPMRVGYNGATLYAQTVAEVQQSSCLAFVTDRAGHPRCHHQGVPFSGVAIDAPENGLLSTSTLYRDGYPQPMPYRTPS